MTIVKNQSKINGGNKFCSQQNISIAKRTVAAQRTVLNDVIRVLADRRRFSHGFAQYAQLPNLSKNVAGEIQ
jgi:hypothetical protein